MSDDLRYPVGRFQATSDPTTADRARWLDELAQVPERMRAAVQGLDDAQLDTPYRDGGWTVRQVVHHVPDSHLNGYVRTCLALTEDEPTIRPYNEAAWSDLRYMRTAPVEPSLALLESVHHRWVAVLRDLTDTDVQRRYIHPEGGPYTLQLQLAHYAWHGRHHVAHITRLRDRRGW